jgi:hypothetical protein
VEIEGQVKQLARELKIPWWVAKRTLDDYGIMAVRRWQQLLEEDSGGRWTDIDYSILCK